MTNHLLSCVEIALNEAYLLFNRRRAVATEIDRRRLDLFISVLGAAITRVEGKARREATNKIDPLTDD